MKAPVTEVIVAATDPETGDIGRSMETPAENRWAVVKLPKRCRISRLPSRAPQLAAIAADGPTRPRQMARINPVASNRSRSADTPQCLGLLAFEFDVGAQLQNRSRS